jgi:DNA-binding CsgD family transcriptional regulator
MLAMAESRAESLPRSLALFLGGLIAWLRGDLREAAAQEVEALRLKQARERDDLYGVAMCLEVLAWITAGQQRHRRAATLLGTADALWTSTGTSVTAFGHFIGHHTACERQIRDTLGDAAFQQALHEGQVLTYEDVFAFALDEPKQPGRAPQEDALIPLTRREQQVAGLIGQGASNKDIAATLVISQRTAEGHVERILTKLGFTNRAQVAALVAARSTEQDSRPGTFT